MAVSTPERIPSTPPPARPAAPPKGRTRKPSAKVLEAQQSLGTRTTALRSAQSSPGSTASQSTQNDRHRTGNYQPHHKCSAKRTAINRITIIAERATTIPHLTLIHPPERKRRSNELGEVAELIAGLKETIAQQSSVIASQNRIIEGVRTDLAAIKAEQQYLKSQNAELYVVVASRVVIFDNSSAHRMKRKQWEDPIG
ncbi:hypothetical protein K469DRAFT_812479 [Zopfia rhizophila CBS 207.26]|uniref:Uncharacterized protein n=1 Tax=Zopfia rhizophila CBS 207.26 TaxID=1314779 RepID=A0A6A6DBG1_9PEZI|nr:hypothetical protein K469DRAFT_812479 [Zopfia rhizophila CBS 207.26]